MQFESDANFWDGNNGFDDRPRSGRSATATSQLNGNDLGNPMPREVVPKILQARRTEVEQRDRLAGWTGFQWISLRR